MASVLHLSSVHEAMMAALIGSCFSGATSLPCKSIGPANPGHVTAEGVFVVAVLELAHAVKLQIAKSRSKDFMAWTLRARATRASTRERSWWRRPII